MEFSYHPLPSPSMGEGEGGGEEVRIACLCGRQETVPNLRKDNHHIPPLEKGGERGFESGLSPKYTSLRRWNGFTIYSGDTRTST